LQDGDEETLLRFAANNGIEEVREKCYSSVSGVKYASNNFKKRLLVIHHLPKKNTDLTIQMLFCSQFNSKKYGC
jgi:hypothetical protein